MGMYCREMIKIGKAENGYIIEACVPLKPTGKASKGNTPMLGGPDMEAQYVAASVDDCVAKIKELLPKLDDSYTDEKAFETAFGNAVSSMSEEGDD